MMSESTIDEIRAERRELENQLRKLVREFTEKHHIEISRIYVDAIRTEGNELPIDYIVEVDAGL
jgi:hypothetical protein